MRSREWAQPERRLPPRMRRLKSLPPIFPMGSAPLRSRRLATSSVFVLAAVTASTRFRSS